MRHQTFFKSFITLLIIVFCLPGAMVTYGQSKKECRKILKKKTQVMEIMDNPSVFFQDYETLLKCNCDSSDFALLSIKDFGEDSFGSKVLSMLILDVLTNIGDEDINDKYIEFADLNNKVQQFISSEKYAEIKVLEQKTKEIENTVPDINNWKQDSIKMDSLKSYSSEEYAVIKEMVAVGSFSSYKTLLNEYKMQTIIKVDSLAKVQMDSLYALGKVQVVGNLMAYNDFSYGLEQAKKSGKPALIYFTGYGCVNSSEMEGVVLSDLKIIDIINTRFECVRLIVDDKTPLEPHDVYTSTASNLRITTVGKKNADIQMSYFNEDRLPFFAILKPDGTVFATTSYTISIADFKQFLLSYFNQ